MSSENDLERKITDYLRRNGKSTVLSIRKDLGLDKSTVNKHLYSLQDSRQVSRTDGTPPVWNLLEKNPEEVRPEQKSGPEEVVRDLLRTSEISRALGQENNPTKKLLYGLEKNPAEVRPEQKSGPEEVVRDLLRSGGLRASEISRALGQESKPTKKLLYGLEKKGEVRRCSRSNLWSLNQQNHELHHQQRAPQGSSASPSGLSQSFDVIRTLGQGGFGRVYQVKHKYDGETYAVKSVILTGNADLEVKALVKLHHPNIVRYITCWSDSENWTSNRVSETSGSSDVVMFDRSGCEESDDDDDVTDDVTSGMESLVMSESESASAAQFLGNGDSGGFDPSHRTCLLIQMEFCDGGTLTRWIEERNDGRKPRTSVDVYRTFNGIISGVEHIHLKSLIHRDLKPDNILFGADGEVKIGDFGLVAAQTDGDGNPIQRSKRKGTRSYMSPEQMSESHYDEKTDIFPLGLIWFEMLWRISTVSEKIKLWPDLRNQSFPEEFSDAHPNDRMFLKQLLSFRPELRPNATDIRENLECFFLQNHKLRPETT